MGLRYVSEGAYITPASTIASLQKIDFLKIDFSVPQKYFSDIKKGSMLNFRVPPDTSSYHVVVLATEPKINEQTRTFRIRGRFSNSGKNLLPGSYAEVDIITNENPSSIMIPSIALIPDLSSEYVLVYNNGKAIKRNVRTGVRSTEQIEIIEGLGMGDTVITSGIMQLKPGDAVKISVNPQMSIVK
jgi:membrane fusion protein (multidrug efflux system)